MRVLETHGLALGRPLSPEERLPLPGVEPQGGRAIRRRPATEEEYPRLTLREKINHHLDSAHIAYMEAGPMWRNKSGYATVLSLAGRPASKAEMTDRWHDLVARAKNHEAEAKRLKGFLTQR